MNFGYVRIYIGHIWDIRPGYIWDIRPGYIWKKIPETISSIPFSGLNIIPGFL